MDTAAVLVRPRMVVEQQSGDKSELNSVGRVSRNSGTGYISFTKENISQLKKSIQGRKTPCSKSVPREPGTTAASTNSYSQIFARRVKPNILGRLTPLAGPARSLERGVNRTPSVTRPGRIEVKPKPVQKEPIKKKLIKNHQRTRTPSPMNEREPGAADPKFGIFARTQRFASRFQSTTKTVSSPTPDK